MAEELVRAAPLEAGWAALSGGDWERARASFEESLAGGETPEALEGMGWVGHMLNADRLTFDAHIINTGTDSYRLRTAQARHQSARTG